MERRSNRSMIALSGPTRGYGGERLIGRRIEAEGKGALCALWAMKWLQLEVKASLSTKLKAESRSRTTLVQGQIAGRSMHSLDKTAKCHWFDGSMLSFKRKLGLLLHKLLLGAFQDGKWKGTIESCMLCNLTEISRVLLFPPFPWPFQSVIVLAWKYIFLSVMYWKIR